MANDIPDLTKLSQKKTSATDIPDLTALGEKKKPIASPSGSSGLESPLPLADAFANNNRSGPVFPEGYSDHYKQVDVANVKRLLGVQAKVPESVQLPPQMAADIQKTKTDVAQVIKDAPKLPQKPVDGEQIPAAKEYFNELQQYSPEVQQEMQKVAPGQNDIPQLSNSDGEQHRRPVEEEKFAIIGSNIPILGPIINQFDKGVVGGVASVMDFMDGANRMLNDSFTSITGIDIKGDTLFKKASDYLHSNDAVWEEQKVFGSETLGDLTKSAGELVPMLATLEGVPGLKIAGAVLPKFSLYMGTTAGLDTYGKAREEGANPVDALNSSINAAIPATLTGLLFDTFGYKAGELGQVAAAITKSPLLSAATSVGGNAAGFVASGKVMTELQGGEYTQDQAKHDALLGIALGAKGLVKGGAHSLALALRARADQNFYSVDPYAIPLELRNQIKADPSKGREEAFRLREEAAAMTDEVQKNQKLVAAGAIDTLVDAVVVGDIVVKHAANVKELIKEDPTLTPEQKEPLLAHVDKVVNASDSRYPEAVKIGADISAAQKEIDAINSNTELPAEVKAAQTAPIIEKQGKSRLALTELYKTAPKEVKPEPVKAVSVKIDSRSAYEQSLETVSKMPEKQRETHMALADAQAELWAKETGGKAEDWYAQTFGTIQNDAAHVEKIAKANKISTEEARKLLLEKTGGEDPNGFVEFNKQNKAVITIYESADSTTRLHEDLGHTYVQRRILEAVSGTGRGSEIIGKTIEAYNAENPDAKLSAADVLSGKGKAYNDLHEYFTSGWEKWADGKFNGDAKMPKVFEQFRDWIISTYEKLGGKITPSRQMQKLYEEMVGLKKEAPKQDVGAKTEKVPQKETVSQNGKDSQIETKEVQPILAKPEYEVKLEAAKKELAADPENKTLQRKVKTYQAVSDANAPKKAESAVEKVEPKPEGQILKQENSLGKKIADTEEKVKNFNKWFGDSKVVDEKGRPLVVYHGTTGDFDKFISGMFAKNPVYSDSFTKGEGGSIIPVYLSIDRLADGNKIWKETDKLGLEGDAAINWVKDNYDGLFLKKKGIDDTHYIVFDPANIKSAIGNSGEYSKADGSILKQERRDKEIKLSDGRVVNTKPLPEGLKIVEGFYSPIEKKILEFPGAKKTAEQWLQDFGKTKDETVYTGLTEYLGAKKPKEMVSKEELRGVLANGRIEIRQIEKENKNNYDELSKRFDELATKENDGTITKAEKRELDDLEPRISKGESDGEDMTKFSQWQLEGEKQDYKEILVTVPSKIKAEAQWHVYSKEGNIVNVPGMSDPKEAQRIADIMGGFIKSIDKYSGQENDFQSAHFDEPNIVVHDRLNTRKTTEGRKVTFAEEIQSDWGEHGKKEGFKDNSIKVSDYELVDSKTGPGYHFVNKNTKEILKDQNGNEARFGDKEGALNWLRIKLNNGIPNAPFITKTPAWTKLGLKIAMREAVKQGSQYLSWTTGEQQNDRYDLSSTLESVSVTNSKKGERLVYIRAKNNSDGTYRVDDNGMIIESGRNNLTGDVTGKRLEDVVGKDLTDKVMSKSGAISNFSEAAKPQSVRELADNVFGRKMALAMPLEPMDGGVLAASNHDQVRRSIISFLPVDVVDILRRKQLSANDIFSNNDMVSSKLSVNESEAVGIGIVSAVRKTGALLRAKLSDLGKGGDEQLLLPALKASDLNSREVAGIVSGSSIFHLDSGSLPKEGASARPIAKPFGEGLAWAPKGELAPAELAKLLNIHDNLIGGGKDNSLRSKYQAPDENIIKGDDFKIQSKGMIGFYGSPGEKKLGIVGEVAESLWGKGSVREVEIQTAPNSEDYYSIWNKHTGNAVSGGYRLSEAKAKVEQRPEDWEYKLERKSGSPQHAVEITPEMRYEAQNGMPLFQKRAEQKKIEDSEREIVRAGIEGQINDLFAKTGLTRELGASFDNKKISPINKVMGLSVQLDVLHRKYLATPTANLAAKYMGKLIGHHNVVLRNSVKAVETMIADIQLTTAERSREELMKGEKNVALRNSSELYYSIAKMLSSPPLPNREAFVQAQNSDFQKLSPREQKSAWISNNLNIKSMEGTRIKDSVRRLHMALDPDFYNEPPTMETLIAKLEKDGVAYKLKGEEWLNEKYKEATQSFAHLMEKNNHELVEEKDLTPTELDVFNVLRTAFDLINDVSFINGHIDSKTHLEHKGKYIPRLYDEYETVKDLGEEFGKFLSEKVVSDIYKPKGDVDAWKYEHIIQDPIYGLAKRYAQVMVNKPIVEYAKEVMATKETVSGVEKLKYIGVPTQPGYVEMGKAFGFPDNTWVRKDIAEKFKGIFYTNKFIKSTVAAGDWYANLGSNLLINRKNLKKLVTVYMPPVRIGNVLGNMVFANKLGISPPRYFYHYFEMAGSNAIGKGEWGDYKKVYDYLERHAVVDKKVNLEDMKSRVNRLQSILSESEKTGNWEWLKKTDEWLVKTYQAVDTHGKMAAFKSLIELGIDKEVAVEMVADGFQNLNRAGRAYKYGSQIPVFGPPFGSFMGDMTRILRASAYSPIGTAYLIAGLKAIAFAGSVAGVSVANDDKEKKWAKEGKLKTIFGVNFHTKETDRERGDREGRKGFPKIPMPNFIGDIPLAYKWGGAEVNLARYITPISVYAGFDDSDDIEKLLMRVLPIWGEGISEVEVTDIMERTLKTITINQRDILTNPLSGFLFNVDNMGNIIGDPTISDYAKEGTLTEGQRVVNRLRFMAKGYTPWGGVIDDLVRVSKTGKDYYGRDRTVSQILLRNLGYNAQLWNDDRYLKIVEAKGKKYLKSIDIIIGTIGSEFGTINAQGDEEQNSYVGSLTKMLKQDISESERNSLSSKGLLIPGSYYVVKGKDVKNDLIFKAISETEYELAERLPFTVIDKVQYDLKMKEEVLKLNVQLKLFSDYLKEHQSELPTPTLKDILDNLPTKEVIKSKTGINTDDVND